MSYLKRLRICDLVHSSSTHLFHLTARRTAKATTSVSISVLLVICLAGGFGSTHDLGEHADEDDAKCGKAGADNADVDFDVGPVDHFDLVPGWVG